MMSDADCTPSREPRSIAASIINIMHIDGHVQHLLAVFWIVA